VRVWKFPDQVVRLGILLIVAIVAVVVARGFFVPKSFGEKGHYRAEAVELVANLGTHYAGSVVCAECHDDVAATKRASYHRNLACEVCHGPAAAHAADPESQKPVIPRERGKACLYCHEYLSSRPTGFPQIIERVHNPLKACIGCHNPHDPKPPTVPSTCGACHAEIARTKAVSHHQDLSCETCHETSAKHREDPRANLAKKPTQREFCGRCHAPNASGPKEAPRVDIVSHGGRYLCWQCHYPHHPES